MTKNCDTRSTNEPKNGGERRSNETKRQSNDKKTGVQLRCSKGGDAQVQIIALKHTNTVHAANNKDDDKQKQRVSDQTVDGKKSKNNGIIGRKVTEIVVDTRLSIDPSLGLGHALDIKKVSDRLEIRESVL